MKIHENSVNDPACPKEAPILNHGDECNLPGITHCVYPKEGEKCPREYFCDCPVEQHCTGKKTWCFHRKGKDGIGNCRYDGNDPACPKEEPAANMIDQCYVSKSLRCVYPKEGAKCPPKVYLCHTCIPLPHKYTSATQTIRIKRGSGITSKKTKDVRKITQITRLVQRRSQNPVLNVSCHPRPSIKVVCILKKGQSAHQMNTSAQDHYAITLERRPGISGTKTRVVRKTLRCNISKVVNETLELIFCVPCCLFLLCCVSQAEKKNPAYGRY